MDKNLGKVTIAPNVLVTIVQKTACSVPGVARLWDRVPGVHRLLGLPTVGQGVRVNVVDDRVVANVYLIARPETDLLHMGRQLQRQVTRDIEHIVGMSVREINVHIEDIETPLTQARAQKKDRAG